MLGRNVVSDALGRQLWLINPFEFVALAGDFQKKKNLLTPLLQINYFCFVLIGVIAFFGAL
jgi:hypothetical protein